MSTSTANWIAAVRARESRRPDRLFDDPFADRLAGQRGERVMAASERATGEENAYIPVRVRWFDDTTMAAVADGVRQVVLLGAGLDTRPWRLVLPADLDWFELDRAELFAEKEPALSGDPPRCRRHVVAADVTGDWVGPLHAAGFEVCRRTLWLAEGLLFYLSPESVAALLSATARSSAPESMFLADVIGEAGLRGPMMQPYLDYCARNGMPPPFGCDDPENLLRAAGWVPHLITAPGAPDANFGRLPAAEPGVRAGRSHFVVGRLRPPS